MTPDEQLRLYPRETLRWLRRRLRVSQVGFAAHVGLSMAAAAAWEARRQGIAPQNRRHFVAFLAPHLATPEGEAFARSLERRGE